MMDANPEFSGDFEELQLQIYYHSTMRRCLKSVSIAETGLSPRFPTLAAAAHCV